MATGKFYIGDLFEVVSGKTTKLYSVSRGNTPFVSATQYNNGISEYIDEPPTFKKNLITVSRNGSVCEAFFQPMPFCASLDDIRVLTPKGFTLNVYSGLYICALIRQEKFRYNYGRKFGTERIKQTRISLPINGSGQIDWDVIQKISETHLREASQKVMDIFNGNYSNEPLLNDKYIIDTEKWKYFRLSDIFDIRKGKRLTKEEMEEGNTPFIGAIDSNNGWSDRIGQPAIYSGNVITVNYDGNGVAEAYYQPVPFWALDSVNVLCPKFQLNVYVALFICAIIKREKYRFSYGRKWNAGRMAESNIKLPAKGGTPDIEFMENYIKSLHYSSSLITEFTKVQHIQPPKPTNIKTGLTDEELIKKYETGEKVNFDKALKKMAKSPSPTTLSKSKS